jgi:hypothetical protein
VYASIGDKMGSDSNDIDSSWVLDIRSTFHVCPRRDWFDFFREVFDGTMILVDGSTLSVVGVGTVRFRIWDGMIYTVIDIRYVPGIRRSLVSLSELDSHGYELWIYGGSMEVLCGDMVVIRGTRHGGLYEIVDTMESASTIVSASTPTWRVVEGDDMTDYGGAATVETCHMVVNVIA